MSQCLLVIAERQLPDGSFSGDLFGEVDSRFSYCAIACLSLLGRLDRINVGMAASFIDSCRNPDGAYGAVPGAESHAGQGESWTFYSVPTLVFCCVAALNILGRLDLVDRDRLAEWLVWRQLPCGGLNGRPEKLEDVCYSWWVLSSLAILNPSLTWIDSDRLRLFILACQDPIEGGFSDRPGDLPDIFHTLFAVTGLSLIGKEGGLAAVDPAYCLPRSVIQKIINIFK